MMEAKFEKAFLKAAKKHAGIKKQIEQKVRQIIKHPIEIGEPLKGNFRGFYSCPVKRNFIIIYLSLLQDAIRLYAGPLNRIPTTTPKGKPFTLLNMPYFLSGKIKEYIEWMIAGA